MLAFVQLNLMYFWSNLSILDILKRWLKEFVMRKFCSKSKQIYFVHPRGSISIEIKQSVVVGTILVMSFRSNHSCFERKYYVK